MSGARRARAPAAQGQGTVACPSCGRPALLAPENRWRPFCSERCRLTDLGAWASERYRIPAKPEPGGGSDNQG